LAKTSSFEVKHVHVVGAGVMGGDIAIWCAAQGLTVSVQDQDMKRLVPVYKRAKKIFKRKLKDNRLITEAYDRITLDTNAEGIKKADVIIEAIFEDLEAKKKLFKFVEQHAKPSAILATNTSSIPLEEIASCLDKPHRLVGIHFFNPVAKMPLIEIVKASTTDQKVLDDAMAFAKRVDKLPLPVKSHPGFLVNRVLMPYLMEAILMLQEGVSAEDIDDAAMQFGMPMGPIELADKVGLDICLAVGKELAQAFGRTVPRYLIDQVDKGELGVKSQAGFYSYRNGKIIKKSIQKDLQLDKSIIERLIFAMINEAQSCMEEGIVESEELLDAGMIFGTGFAPFRGGLLHYHQHMQQL